jgi:hypothetical protein
MFLKSVDALDKVKSAQLISEMMNLFKKLPTMQLIIWLLVDFLSLGTPPYFGPLVLHIA